MNKEKENPSDQGPIAWTQGIFPNFYQKGFGPESCMENSGVSLKYKKLFF